MRKVAAGAAIVAAVAGIAYSATAIAQLQRFGRRVTSEREHEHSGPGLPWRREGRPSQGSAARSSQGPAPGQPRPATSALVWPRAALPPLGVTVLKPLHGAEHQLEENLLSFCRQSYPLVQVIFGAADADDPALAVARRVKAALPMHDIAISVGQVPSVHNPKVATLAKMLPEAKHEIIVIADSDIRVGAEYLGNIVAEFEDPGVGAVTCLYRGDPADGLASTLGAMHIEDEFAPSVLVSLLLDRLRFCFGATVALRRSALETIGGFAAVGSYLADDYMLGKLVSDLGYEVVLSSYVVTSTVHEPTFASLWSREVRWARTIRAVRPAGYALSFVTNPVPLALAYLALSGNVRVGLALYAIGAGMRWKIHEAAAEALGTSRRVEPWLFPLRGALSTATFIAGLLGRSVHWKGRRHALGANSRL